MIDPRVLVLGLDVLKQEGAEKLVLNGDLVGEKFPHLNKHDYLATLLEICGRSGLETNAQPASHEEVRIFHPVFAAYTKKYSNIIDIFQNPKQRYTKELVAAMIE